MKERQITNFNRQDGFFSFSPFKFGYLALIAKRLFGGSLYTYIEILLALISRQNGAFTEIDSQIFLDLLDN